MKLFWKLLYKLYKPKSKKAIINKWERLEYADFDKLPEHYNTAKSGKYIVIPRQEMEM